LVTAESTIERIRMIANSANRICADLLWEFSAVFVCFLLFTIFVAIFILTK